MNGFFLSLWLVLLSFSAEGQTVDSAKRAALESQMKSLESSISDPKSPLNQYCLHGRGNSNLRTQNGVTSGSYSCSEGYTSLYFVEKWAKEGRKFSSLKPEEYQGFCEAEFISKVEEIYPGYECSLYLDFVGTSENSEKKGEIARGLFVNCKQALNSDHLFDSDFESKPPKTFPADKQFQPYCKKVIDEKIASEQTCSVKGAPLSPSQAAIIGKAKDELSKANGNH